MQVCDFIETILPLNIPEIFKDNLRIVVNCLPTEREIKIFGLALAGIENELKLDHISNQQLAAINVIFTKDGSYSIVEENDTIYGTHISFAIYMLERLRKRNDECFTLFTFVEELAHHYWKIEDEVEIKFKVLKIVQSIIPAVTMDMIRKWGFDGI